MLGHVRERFVRLAPCTPKRIEALVAIEIVGDPVAVVIGHIGRVGKIANAKPLSCRLRNSGTLSTAGWPGVHRLYESGSGSIGTHVSVVASRPVGVTAPWPLD